MNVSTRKDRLKMAQALAALVVPGWTVTINDKENAPDASVYDKRRIDVCFKGPRGLSLNVDLDGKMKQQRQDCFVLSWYGVDSPHKLALTFAPSVNSYHFHKATDVMTFEGMLEWLPKRFREAVSGAAFQEVSP